MLSPVAYESLIDIALREDLGSGDITTEATVEVGTRAKADAVARGPVVVCGGDIFAAVFRRIDPRVACSVMVADGEMVGRGSAIWRVKGEARSLLGAERVALNFVQRLSGIATLTRAFVDAIPSGCSTRIADTRKTTPGLRVLERYAVRVGGGHNHRDCLGSAVLIKDNHIVAAGGITAAVTRARAYAPHTTRVELEVDTLVQLDEALDVGADIIMLDNFSVEDTRIAVQRAKGRAVLEVSGGVSVDCVAEVARLGVDVISVGALTHSAKAADIGLDMELEP
ncbi:MAG: carboxylating nicotinate-nucleotide diphosphorylase [Polyangiaceae bacterium]|nr:carboxylating nicotinate-nucleotide diphosphorylase [Polyangiaceae bacterium]